LKWHNLEWKLCVSFPTNSTSLTIKQLVAERFSHLGPTLGVDAEVLMGSNINSPLNATYMTKEEYISLGISSIW
jgi:hypothetical protein